MAKTRINVLEAQMAAQKIGNAASDIEVYAQKLHNSVEKIGEHWQGQAYHKFYALAADLSLQLRRANENVMTIYTRVVQSMQGYESQDSQ